MYRNRSRMECTQVAAELTGNGCRNEGRTEGRQIDYGLKNLAVLVTGAGSNLGRSSAVMAAAEGARVGVADVNRQAAEETVAMIEAAGGTAMSLVFDVTDEAQTEAALDMLEAAYGPLYGLVACAGLSRPAMALDMTEEMWSAVIDVNLTGAFQSCQSAGRRMIRAGRGSIVTIGSTAALAGHARGAVYCASKHAVVGFTRVLATEWGALGVRVNCVVPGPIDSVMLRKSMPADYLDAVLVDRTPVNRLGQPEDIAGAAMFLLSSGATYVNGITMPVDGGLTTGFMNRWNGRDLSSNASRPFAAPTES